MAAWKGHFDGMKKEILTVGEHIRESILLQCLMEEMHDGDIPLVIDEVKHGQQLEIISLGQAAQVVHLEPVSFVQEMTNRNIVQLNVASAESLLDVYEHSEAPLVRITILLNASVWCL